MRAFFTGLLRSIQLSCAIMALVSVVTILFASFAVPLVVLIGVLQIPVELMKGH